MKTATIIMTIGVMIAGLSPCARGQFRPSRIEMGPRVMFFEAFPVRPGPDSLRDRINVHYRIDREFFVPVRDPEGHAPFHRSGEILVELADSTGGIASRAMRSLEIPEQDADRKPFGLQWEQGIFSLEAPPGNYRIQITAEDQESRRTTMDSSRFVRMPRHGAAGLSTASAVFVVPPGETRGAPGSVALVNFGEEILFGRPAALLLHWVSAGTRDSVLHVRYAFAEEPPAPDDLPFLPADGEVTVPVFHGVGFETLADSGRVGYTFTADRPRETCAAVVPLPLARLLLRSYKVTLTLSSGSDKYELVRKGRAVWPDMPFSLKDIDNALDALRYITTEPQLDSLRRGNFETRRANLESFWRQKGGKPETAFNEVMTEYYRRADFATRTYGTMRLPDGFRSDRGKIYVLYGPPTSTDRTLDPAAGFQEIWTYAHLKKKFTFVDQNKSGNYVLVSAAAL